jgi:hypothetical protein
LYYHVSGEDPDAGSVEVTKVYYYRAGKTTVQGQAEVSNPDQRPYGKEWQAVSGSGQAEVNNPEGCDKVQNDRQAQGQGRQNSQNLENKKTGTKRQEQGEA